MRDLLVQLNLVPGVGSARLDALTAHFPDLEAFLAADTREVAAAGGLNEEAAQALKAEVRKHPAEKEMQAATALGLTIVTAAEAGYPLPLREVTGAPAVLYRKGEYLASDHKAVAVVGTRKPTPSGTSVAERFGRQLADAGVTVVSGMARGVDGAAHRGALEAGGRTIAVLGCGLDRCYPHEHRRLLATIAENGAVLSEFPLGMPPLPGNFPRRNRIISGLTRGVVVVEAAARSGSLITARLALEQGRDVFAVPGPITSPFSRGTHALLRQGARLLADIQDIFEELGWNRPDTRPDVRNLTDEERRLLEHLGPEPISTDRLASKAGIAADRLATLISLLELKDLVRDAGGGRVVGI